MSNLSPGQRARNDVARVCALLGAAREALEAAREVVTDTLSVETLQKFDALTKAHEATKLLRACEEGLSETHDAWQKVMLSLPKVDVAAAKPMPHGRIGPKGMRLPDDFRLVSDN